MQELSLIALVAALASVAAFILSAASVRKARREARKAQQALDELVLLEQTVDMLRTGIKRIEGRQVKASQRLKAEPEPDACPDPKLDPEGWKRWQTKALNKARSRLQ